MKCGFDRNGWCPRGQARAELLESRVLLSAGQLAPSFGQAGVVAGPNTFGGEEGSDVAVQPDGRVLMGGTRYGPGGASASLTRFNVDGSPNASVGTGGTVVVHFGEGDSVGGVVSLRGDGRIIFAGTLRATGGGTARFAVARFTPDGKPDPTFGTAGTPAAPRKSPGSSPSPPRPAERWSRPDLRTATPSPSSGTPPPAPSIARSASTAWPRRTSDRTQTTSSQRSRSSRTGACLPAAPDSPVRRVVTTPTSSSPASPPWAGSTPPSVPTGRSGTNGEPDG